VIVDAGVGDVDALVVTETAKFAGHSGDPAIGHLFPDVIVPLHAVADASRDRIDLTIDSLAVRNLRPYLSHRFVISSRGDALRVELSAAFGAPAMPMADIHSNKRDDELEVKRGENVMVGHHGDKFGHVHDLTDRTSADREHTIS